MRQFLFLILFLFNPSIVLANTELTEIIIEVSVNGSNSDTAQLEKKGIRKGLQLGLLQTARKLSRQELNTSILDHYKKIRFPEKKGYVHGYNIVSRHYDHNIGIFNLVLKAVYFSSPIRSDILNFGLQQNVSADKGTVYLISTRLINDSPEGIISLSDIISEEFEFSGTRGGFLVKGERAFQKEENLHQKYHAKLIVMVNLAFSKEKEAEGIRGFLSYKVIDKTNTTLKAMSFSDTAGENGEGESSEWVYTLTRQLMQKLLESYSDKNQ